MMTAEAAVARLHAAAIIARGAISDLRTELGDQGAPLELVTSRLRDLHRNEPEHLRKDQLVELYCLELIESLKSWRLAEGLQ